MKRVVLAALVAAAGVIVLGAPARATPPHEATMSPDPNAGIGNPPYKFAAGTCGNVTGSGDFSVQSGDKITWTNCTQNVVHTVTSDTGAWPDQGDVAYNQSVTISFTNPSSQPIVYRYHCVHHSNMTGQVTVAPATTTTEKATTTTQAVTTTSKPTTTTTSTTVGPTTTTEDINGVFGSDTTPTEPTTTLFTTDTTRALGHGGSSGTSAGVVAGLIVGLGAIGTAAALVIRKMRAGASPP